MPKLFIFFILISFQTLVCQEKSKRIVNKDNYKALEQKLEHSKALTSKALYPEAYDEIWEVLITADAIKNAKIKYKAYQHLSTLYSIFYKKNKAIAAIDSVFFYAKKSGDFNKTNIKFNLYYSAALTFRMNGNYQKAKEYLTIAEQLLDSSKGNKVYFFTEKAHLYTLTNKYKDAEEILLSIVNKITAKHQYASIVYSMLGDLYMAKKEYKKALFYYNKSLLVINKQKSRIGLKADLLKKTSKINSELKNYKLAFQQMNLSKTLGDSLFGSQSERNNRLFEIKDSYRKSIIESNRIQKEQQLQLAKNEKDKFRLQFIFAVTLFLLTTVATFFVIRLQRKKHQIEKNLATERANAELEIQKKELAVTALQLMEKDKLLNEIKQGLEAVKKQDDDVQIAQLKSTINVNSTKMWQDFEARFVQVNTSFYKSLGEKHPNLSRNELKLCALVKLNFSIKEMSQLLGISNDGVSKARYRLRKKLALQRDENLTAYMNSI